jgi:hypothetical protein
MQQMCHPHMKAWLRGSMPCLPLVAMPMGIAVAGADTVYLAQQQNVMAAPQPTSVAPRMGMVTTNLVVAQIDQQRDVMAAPQPASVAPPMGMVMANPVTAQIDQQRNPLIGTEANRYQLSLTLIDDL